MQWRLGDVDSFSFDEAAYSATLAAGYQRLVISRLGKKTGEFNSVVQGTIDTLRQRSAEALHKLFPFLDPDRLQSLLTVMPEGCSVKLTTLAGIDPKLVDALLARAVTAGHKPYFDARRSRSGQDSLMTLFKFIREDREAPGPRTAADGWASSGADAGLLLVLLCVFAASRFTCRRNRWSSRRASTAMLSGLPNWPTCASSVRHFAAALSILRSRHGARNRSPPRDNSGQEMAASSST